MRRLFVDVEQARQIHRAVDGKYLPGLQFEVGAQAFDDFGIGVRLDLQPHRIAFAPVVQFGAHRFQQVARFFFRQIEIAVAGDAECRRGNDVVAVIHPRGVECHQVGQKDEVVGPVRRQPHQARQGPRHRDHAGVGKRRTAAAAQQESHAQSLVDHSRKGMRRVHRHRRQQQVEFLLAILFDESAGAGIQFVQTQNADAMRRRAPGAASSFQQLILVVDELVSLAGNHIALLDQGEAVRPGFGVSVFDLLHQSGHAHFEEFIQVAGGDGKKFQALEQRVLLILRFFEDAAIEGQPGGFPVDVIGRIVEREACHISKLASCRVRTVPDDDFEPGE